MKQARQGLGVSGSRGWNHSHNWEEAGDSPYFCAFQTCIILRGTLSVLDHKYLNRVDLSLSW